MSVRKDFKIVVLCGALSPEREVSINSAKACAQALSAAFPRVELRVLDANALPEDLEPARDIIFPLIHGDYGEDGGIQRDLEARGFAYAGCDVPASELCIDKVKTKAVLRAGGVPVAQEIAFLESARPSAKTLIAELGEAIVVKPADKGSSVGLFVTESESALQTVLDGDLSAAKKWLAETRLRGRELTVGLLGGRALGIVEIRPRAGTGIYDFQNKYTSGNTEYIVPAPIEAGIAQAICAAAEKAFELCRCRDFARADAILSPADTFNFLEINTMPGMTATSLLPKCASCAGMDFFALAKAMIAPAITRFEQK